MRCAVTEQQIVIVGGLAFLFSLYSLWMGRITTPGLPDGYSNPVLALELVKSGDDIKTIVGPEGSTTRRFLRKSTYKDFGYILVYAIFFVSLSLLLSRMNFSWTRWVGLLAAACAILAAVLDLIEDRGMLKAIKGEASDSLANSIRYPSLAKWGFLFVFSLLVGLLLIARRDAFAIPALFFLLAALLGLSGVIFNLLRPRFYWTFPAALYSIGFGIIILAVAFTFYPHKLLSSFTPLTP